MNLPFISRKRHNQIVKETKGRISVYVPAEYPSTNGKPVQIPAGDYAYHDSRIGWVRLVEFDTYKDYTDYLKEVNKAKQYVALKKHKGVSEGQRPVSKTERVGSTPATPAKKKRSW
jgi:hypothetical protein